MKRQWVLGMVIAVAVNVAATRCARAQAIEHLTPIPQGAVVYDGGFASAPAAPSRWYPGRAVVNSMRPCADEWHRTQNWLGCRSNHNTLGCGSLRSELTFWFGSCRTFFGEPCDKGPAVPGYGPSNGWLQGAKGGQQGGCSHCP